MRVVLRTFKGEACKPIELPPSLAQLHEVAAKTFGRAGSEVTILRLGVRVQTEEAFEALSLKDCDVLVVSFGHLQELERHLMKSGQEGVLAVGQESKAEHQGSSLERPEVQAMLNNPEFKKAKERFQSDPSKWETLYTFLIRTFPGAASFCINEKDTLKRIMSQTDFGASGGDGEAEENEEQKIEERELTAQELEEVNSLMALGGDREEVMAVYLKSGRKVDEAANILLSAR